jgi:hypothetical protein
MSAETNVWMGPSPPAAEIQQYVLLGSNAWQTCKFTTTLPYYFCLINGSCTSVSSSQPSTSSQVNSPTNQVSTPSSTPSQVANPSTTIAPSPTTLSTQVSTPSTANAPSPTTLSTQVSKPSSNPLSELNEYAPTSVRTDPAAACFLSTQFTCYYTTPTWYKSLPSDAQSLYSATNAAASHSAFCTSTAVINPKCLNGTHNSGLSPGAEVGVGLGSAAGALAVTALILYLLKACLPASSKVPLAFKPFLPPPPPASIPPGAPGGPQAPQPPANPAQPNVPYQPSYPPYSGPPNTPGVPNGPLSPNPTSPMSSIPPASHPFTSTADPLPLIIGGLRRKDDRNDWNRADTILRKAVPSRQLPDRSGQGINEAGGGPISEMSEAETRSATISSIKDITSGSWCLGAQEVQCSEVAEGVIRHEVPEGVRSYEVPEGTRRYEAPDQQVYEAPGYGSD